MTLAISACVVAFLVLSRQACGQPPKCQKLDKAIASICQNSTFNQVYLPNQFGHLNQTAAAAASSHLWSTAPNGCSKELSLFLCAAYFPPCSTDGGIQAPCRELCNRVRSDCGAQLSSAFDVVLNCTTLSPFDTSKLRAICYDPQPRLVINELNADDPGSDDEEFIEIYDGGVGLTPLDGFVVVLFNGKTSSPPDASYDSIDLAGQKTNSDGYFVIGNAGVNPNLTKKANFLQNGADAVAIYKGNAASFPSGTAPSNVSLIDAVVYSKSDAIDNVLVTALLPHLPGQNQIKEDESFHAYGDESINRCLDLQLLNSSVFKLGRPTPGQTNICNDVPTTPTPSPAIVPCQSPILISEINADSPGSDVNEFIELSDGGIGGTSLDGLVLVLYNGNGDTSYFSVGLTGYATNADGFFLLGSSSLNPGIVLPSNTVQNGADAVALYVASPFDFPSGSPLNSTNLVDAVVYGTNDQPDSGLLAALTPGEIQVNEDFNHHAGEESISRCVGKAPLKLGSFLLSHPTPGSANNCSSTPSIGGSVATRKCSPGSRTALQKTGRGVIINELLLSGSNAFIELFDGGKGGTALDGFTLFTYRGDSSRFVDKWSLKGYTTNPSGFFAVGVGVTESAFSKKVLSLSISYGAVALYDGLGSTKLIDPVVNNLADAVVFGAQSTAVLSSVLSPASPVVKYVTGYSMARLGSTRPFDGGAFKVGDQTLLSANSLAVISQTPSIVINELNADDPDGDTHEFLELYDGGKGNTPLDGYIIVLFNGNHASPVDSSYLTIDLSGNKTNTNGFFLIGSSAVIPRPDRVYPNNFLQNGPDAVAIYQTSASSFSAGTSPTQVNLTDAIVYSKYDFVDFALLNALLPNQSQIKEDDSFHFDSDETINRCFGLRPLNSSLYKLARPTPGQPNDCSDVQSTPAPKPTVIPCQSPILISEINADSPGQDVNEFIELSDGGIGGTSLDGLVLVLYNGNGDKSYFSVGLTGYVTDPNGFFLLGSSSLNPDIVLLPNTVQNGADAVTLYVASLFDFPINTLANSTNLVDAVVYGTNDQPDVGLLDALVPGEVQVNEDWAHHPGEESISRCVGGTPLKLGSFLLSHPTPGSANNCSSTPTVGGNIATRKCSPAGRASLLNTGRGVIINEVFPNGPSAFVELFNGGKGDSSLDGFTLFTYKGDNSRYVDRLSLNGKRTNSSGYFVIGISLDATSGAVALYDGLTFNTLRDPVVNNLADAVVFAAKTTVPSPVLASVLTPGSSPALYVLGFSIGRLGDITPFNNDAFKVGIPSPLASNLVAPTFATPVAPQFPDIVINELNADDPEVDTHEFLELYDGGKGNTPLDGYIVVLYNGNNDNPPDASYEIIDLAGKKTDVKGYFVIGSSSVNPDLVYQDGFIQNGPDAVAIYQAPASSFPQGSPISRKGLIDAIVYNSRTYVDGLLLNALVPGQNQVLEDPQFHYDGDESVSRCGGSLQSLNMSLFRLSRPTPGEANVCDDVASTPAPLPPPVPCKSTFIINEINADTPAGGDDGEFIELYDGGTGGSSLDGVVLVLFNGNFGDKSYLTVALTGYRTDANGFFVLGSASVNSDLVLPGHSIQNGPDAVALYMGSPYDFPRDTPAIQTNLIDAVVYGTKDGTDHSLLNALIPGESQLDEDWETSADDESISRCSCCTQLSSASFLLTRPTPRAENDCPTSPAVLAKDAKSCPLVGRNQLLASDVGVVISEVRPVAPQAFIELYDGGRGNLPLSDLTVFVFSSTSTQYVSMWKLDKYRTNSFGYFLVGVNLPPSAEEMTRLNVSSLNVTAGAVALYSKLPSSPLKDPVVNNLADAVVFGKGPRINTLLAVFSPGQEAIAFDAVSGMSIAKEGTTPFVLTSFREQVSSPGGDNAVSGKGLSGGAIAGIVIGVLIIAVAIALVVIFLFLRKGQPSSKAAASFKFTKQDEHLYSEDV